MLGMMIDAATGVLYLHARSPQILHCDLKSSNLLVDSHFRVKVCDFNLSKVVEESTEIQSGARNPRWLAPEILDGERNTEESDAYAFGIIMWEMITCQIPWSGESSHSIISLVRDGARPRIPNFWDVVDSQGKELAVFEDYRELMTKCWAQNSYDRPRFKAIIKSLKDMIQFVDDRAHPQSSYLQGGQPVLPNDANENALMSASSTAVNASF
jgi:serine/threonine protein kinase